MKHLFRIITILVISAVIALVMTPQFNQYKRRGTDPRGLIYPETFGSIGSTGDLLEQQSAFNTETYDRILDNGVRQTVDHPLSTFSIDVDTASYANVRRFLHHYQLPPKDSVRVEELVNYFPYHYPNTQNREVPFTVSVESAQAFWEPDHSLVRIGLKGRDIPWENRPASNLVFLLDVSGSMNARNKLPLVQRSLKLLVDQLGEQDRIAIVVYAGSSGLVLPSTPGNHRAEILQTLARLRAGGSTNGGAGIQLAYKVAHHNFIEGGVNRVILATDGDFNIGVTNQGDLIRLIQSNAKSGVFLSVLGFGMGNYKDSTLEKLADLGNGHYGYIDTLQEAEKMFVEQISGSLITVAKDVKVQVEFNPLHVASYRLIGYENRLLNQEDFNNDARDAGDLGAGHTVTALYEIVAAETSPSESAVDPLKYQKAPQLSPAAAGGEFMTVKVRFKQPDGEQTELLSFPVQAEKRAFAEASNDFQFAAAVASFGMLLRDSEHRGQTSYSRILQLVDRPENAEEPYRREFAQLVRLAGELSGDHTIPGTN